MISKINSFTNFGSVYLSETGKKNISPITGSINARGIEYDDCVESDFSDVREARSKMFPRSFVILDDEFDTFIVGSADFHNSSEIETEETILQAVKKFDPYAFIVPDYNKFPWQNLESLTKKGIDKAIEEDYFTLSDLKEDADDKFVGSKFGCDRGIFKKLLELGLVKKNDYNRYCSRGYNKNITHDWAYTVKTHI